MGLCSEGYFMLYEMIRELDEKVELLIDKNNQYKRQIEMLQLLLDNANSNMFTGESDQTVETSENFGNEILGELKPLAEKILSKIKEAEDE
jgi:hypothetical protein